MKQMFIEQKNCPRNARKSLKKFWDSDTPWFFRRAGKPLYRLPAFAMDNGGQNSVAHPTHLKFSGQFSFNHDQNSFDFFRVLRVFRGQIIGNAGWRHYPNINAGYATCR
ncbi:MAG: hypothetical protein PHH59_01225 [Methylovulum sp.]|uniref:hypothetical protein n=1 Tax=Methylovulum sp. TaxID=1916980 RepID=UPI002605CE4B|nr:hypothetical protein [Methylovulum sp.]MDD2722629.1 hypothetical protein [Methylovulum sp.]MDD5123899.1 hypothetical protein [Methylovulum sp.]